MTLLVDGDGTLQLFLPLLSPSTLRGFGRFQINWFWKKHYSSKSIKLCKPIYLKIVPISLKLGHLTC